MTRACCVCLGESDLTNSLRICGVCVDTTVCNVCFDIMRKSNIHRKCPVCRSENWCPNSNEVLIITDTDPFAQSNVHHTMSVSINITMDESEQNENDELEAYNCKKRFKLVLKFIMTTIAVWSVGFIAISLTNDRFYLENALIVIFGGVFVGMIITLFSVQLYWLSWI